MRYHPAVSGFLSHWFDSLSRRYGLEAYALRAYHSPPFDQKLHLNRNGPAGRWFSGTIMENTMTDTHTPSPEEIKHVQDEAEDLEDRAKRDGVLPDDEAEGDGVGPQTGIVP